jgi:hypothetical protein
MRPPRRSCRWDSEDSGSRRRVVRVQSKLDNDTTGFLGASRILAERGNKEALPWADGGSFFEIRFDDPSKVDAAVDEEFKDKVIARIVLTGSS